MFQLKTKRPRIGIDSPTIHFQHLQQHTHLQSRKAANHRYTLTDQGQALRSRLDLAAAAPSPIPWRCPSARHSSGRAWHGPGGRCAVLVANLASALLRVACVRSGGKAGFPPLRTQDNRGRLREPLVRLRRRTGPGAARERERRTVGRQERRAWAYASFRVRQSNRLRLRRACPWSVSVLLFLSRYVSQTSEIAHVSECKCI